MSGVDNKLLSAPWHGSAVGASSTRYNHCTIFGQYGIKIAEVQGRGRAATEARRDFIVLACNAHAELVAALRTMIYETTHLSPMEDDGSHWCRITKVTLQAARSALARANGTDDTFTHELTPRLEGKDMRAP